MQTLALLLTRDNYPIINLDMFGVYTGHIAGLSITKTSPQGFKITMITHFLPHLENPNASSFSKSHHTVPGSTANDTKTKKSQSKKK